MGETFINNPTIDNKEYFKWSIEAAQLALQQANVSSPLPLNMIARPSVAGGYYASISYENKLIATQGETVKELLENIVDAYKTLEASGNEN